MLPTPYPPGELRKREQLLNKLGTVANALFWVLATFPRFHYTLPAVAGPAPHSHLVCGGCQTLLMYPQGASNVRCSRCTHITPVPVSTANEMAHIVCNGCRVLLSYPRGSQSVQCSMCHTVTQVSALLGPGA
jgi:LSD1 subclass zinc finger protein